MEHDSHGTRQRIQLIDTIHLQRIRLELQHLRPLILELAFAKNVFWGVPCQFGIHKDISQKKTNITISPCHENWLPSAQPRERSNVAAMAADQGGGVEPPANISTKKILETIASLLATKDPWGPRGGKASNENRWSRLRGPRMGWFKTEVIKDVLSYMGD